MQKIKNVKREILKSLDITTNSELAQTFYFDYEETTTGRNGYPENLNWVLTSDSISELIELKKQLEIQGYEVEELELHKKAGWSLWSRGNDILKLGKYTIAKDTDYSIKLDMNEDEEDIKNNILETLFGTTDLLEIESFEDLEMIVKNVNDFFSEIENEEGTVTVFYSPDNDYSIEYVVSEDTNGYTYDSNYYKLAIRVVDFDID